MASSDSLRAVKPSDDQLYITAGKAKPANLPKLVLLRLRSEANRYKTNSQPGSILVNIWSPGDLGSRQ